MATMAHLMVLLWALAFGAGLAAITLTHHLYRQVRARFLRDYLHYLLAVNLTVGGTVLLVYLAANLAAGWTESDWRPAAGLFLLASFTVVAAFVYKLVSVLAGLLGHEASRAFRVGFAAMATASPLAGLVALWVRHPDMPVPRILATSESLNLVLVAGAVVAILATLAGSRDLAHSEYRRNVRVFCALHLLAYLLIPVAAVIDYAVAFHLLCVSFMTMNLVPLLLLRRLLEHRGTVEPKLPFEADAMEALAGQYGISPREREIIGLLLAGRTNAEIGDALYISANTVKNHVYSVYRKTGVRNRIQLANLIRGTTSGPHGGPVSSG
jgi:DNA-binding CsgD family transcriptional regulator